MYKFYMNEKNYTGKGNNVIVFIKKKVHAEVTRLTRRNSEDHNINLMQPYH